MLITLLTKYIKPQLKFNGVGRTTRSLKLIKIASYTSGTLSDRKNLKLLPLGYSNPFFKVAPIFFKKSIGAFLVYDCTNEDSFYALNSWHEQVSNNADSKVVVMVLGNKVDMPDKKIIQVLKEKDSDL